MSAAPPGPRAGGRGRVSRIAGVALALAGLGALVLGAAGPGHRLGWWDLGPAFAILRSSVYVAAAAGAIALLGLVFSPSARSRKGLVASLLAIVVAAGTAVVPLGMRRAAESVPPIHDITTDTESPPEFVALRPARERSPNGAAYGGAAVAAQQRPAYPDLAPVLLPVPPDRAFARVEAAARGLGWAVITAVPAEGRLEATDTTRWFGFKDDVVVRVTPAPGGSRIDVRSVSRVGRSDLGANARRIRAFLAAVTASAPRPL